MTQQQSFFWLKIAILNAVVAIVAFCLCFLLVFSSFNQLPSEGAKEAITSAEQSLAKLNGQIGSALLARDDVKAAYENAVGQYQASSKYDENVAFGDRTSVFNDRLDRNKYNAVTKARSDMLAAPGRAMNDIIAAYGPSTGTLWNERQTNIAIVDHLMAEAKKADSDFKEAHPFKSLFRKENLVSVWLLLLFYTPASLVVVWLAHEDWRANKK